MTTWKQFKLLDIASVSKTRVSEFSGEKDYIATGDLDFVTISGGTATTYAQRPSRADLVIDDSEVLFAKMKGTVKVLIGSKEVKNKIFSTGFYILKPQGNVSKEFLYFYFLSDYFNKQKDFYCTGATMSALTNEGLKKILISLPVDKNGNPDLAEQKRIVATLEEAESLKKKRAEADQKMNELIPALFIQMFGDLSKYQTKKLGDFCQVMTGNTPPRVKKEFYGSAIEWIKTDNFIEGHLYPSSAKEGLSDAGAKIARIVDENSILMTCIAGSIKSIGNICLTNRRVAFNQQINALTVKDNTNPLFLYWFLRIHKSKTQKLASHVLKFIINKTRLEGLVVSIPSIGLQNQFAEKVKEIEEQKEKQKQSAIQLDVLFSSLLSSSLAS